MQRIIAFFLALLLSVSVGLGATAHAMEPIASIDTTEASLFGHSAGDSDEVPADADKGYPHHHGACHDHGVGVPATAERLSLHEHVAQAPASNGTASLATADPASLLRPPRA